MLGKACVVNINKSNAIFHSPLVFNIYIDGAYLELLLSNCAHVQCDQTGQFIALWATF